jgi:transcriptional regulator with XRE-family HTH domain
MSQINIKLKSLGTRLREERLKRNESQVKFAARIGVSTPTLSRMESGNQSVLIGHWATALEILDRVDDLDAILAVPEDLFAKYEHTKKPQRLRVHAPRRKRSLDIATG